jgi:hypothetical protein
MFGAQSLIAVASLLAAESTSPVWHYWIAVPIALGAIAVVIAVVAGYVAKVTRTRYPKGQG